MQAPFRQPSFSDGQIRRGTIISLTPLIDVVFILLVFFMLASSFSEWRSISIATAKSPSVPRAPTEQKPLLLRVSDSEVHLNGELLELDEIMVRLQERLEQDPQASVKVQPVVDTRLQSVIAVLDELKLAGISRFKMARDRQWAASENVGGN